MKKKVSFTWPWWRDTTLSSGETTMNAKAEKKENFFCIYITLKNGHDIVDLQMKSP